MPAGRKERNQAEQAKGDRTLPDTAGWQEGVGFGLCWNKAPSNESTSLGMPGFGPLRVDDQSSFGVAIRDLLILPKGKLECQSTC